MALFSIIKLYSHCENYALAEVLVFEEIGLLTEAGSIFGKNQSLKILEVWIHKENGFRASNDY